MNKDFEYFRNNVVTDEKLQDIISISKEQADKTDNERNFLATFSANFTLYLLAEYHDWINQS